MGENDTGCLGIVSKSERHKKVTTEFNAVNLTKVIRIFTTSYNSFFECSKGRIYACGLNNYEQLGFKTEPDESLQVVSQYTITEPLLLDYLDGLEIKDIVGGEQHVLILMRNGDIYGAGRNDDGELGLLSDSHILGGYKKLSHVSGCSEIQSYNHYNYALGSSELQYYAWGAGFSYVLANGKEDSLEEARPINNEKFFKENMPRILRIGFGFVCYLSGEMGKQEDLNEAVLSVKKRRNIKVKPQLIENKRLS